MRSLSTCCLLLCLLSAGGTLAQSRSRGIDFLNERLHIPDSDRFRMPDYIESGVGLTFGVDRRLSYLTGNYAEAVERFEAAIKRFRYKSEIWVYLARAYFYEKSPQKARETIMRAATIMPDLKEKFWDPLLESMLGEIRKKALNLQTQVDFYSKSQEDFLTLFRLYMFLEDYPGAIGVVNSARQRSVKMAQLATAVSATSQRAYREESRKWQDLADQLKGELQLVGVDVPAATPAKQENGKEGDESATGDPGLAEETRILQLKVDYYESVPDDYRQLFANYQMLEMPTEAAAVLDALEREIQRTKLEVDIAPNMQQEALMLGRLEEFEAVRKELETALGMSDGNGVAQ